MGVIEPYSPCPCGSGQKFKWCCHKVESFAERSIRLAESGQLELALQPLEEGLRKEPGNAWLTIRKTLLLMKLGREPEARKTARDVLVRQPGHLGALAISIRLLLEAGEATEAVVVLQRGLPALAGRRGPALAMLFKMVGLGLLGSEKFLAGVRHLEFALDTSDEEADEWILNSLASIHSEPQINPWFKQTARLSPVPEALTGGARDQFESALKLEEAGRWGVAAETFESLSADPIAGPLADRNAGLCRLWIGDDDRAVASLRRYVAMLGSTEEAVDTEALCQMLERVDSKGVVELVQLSWPLRNRRALLDALEADSSIHADGSGRLDPEDPASPVVDGFRVLDRPDLERNGPLTDGGKSLTIDAIPNVLGEVHVSQDLAILEVFDDGRLDALSERFTTLAGSAIAPAHPKTKVLVKVPAALLALGWQWRLPDAVERVESIRLNRDQGCRVMNELWPVTPSPILGGLSPIQAAETGRYEVPLRAMVRVLEQARDAWRSVFDFHRLRERLHLPDEPEIEVGAEQLTQVPVFRLDLVRVDSLTNRQLVAYYVRARGENLDEPRRRAAAALVARLDTAEPPEINPAIPYKDLAMIAFQEGRTDEARTLVNHGREVGEPAVRARNAPSFDMLEIRFGLLDGRPEEWAAQLAVILERYQDEDEAMQVLVSELIELGLLQIVSHPERPGEFMIDSRPLQNILGRFGPRVTTSSGRLGVSATKPEIWTPGSAAGGSKGGIWTPGSSPAPAPRPTSGGGEPKGIIITG